MRACNGCRKRKIKCDAATTNTWPCSACTRLKLVCVPPTIGQDSDFQSEQGLEATSMGALGASQANSASHYSYSVPQSFGAGIQPTAGNSQPYSDGAGIMPQYAPNGPTQHNIYEVRSSHLPVTGHAYQHAQVFPTTPNHGLDNSNTGIFPDDDQSTAENLSEVLGELKIDETGIAPYIRQQRKERLEAEAPVQDEIEERLPPLSTGAGSTIRIPPELMPSDDEVMNYFKIYFDDIHPYIPVVHRSHLYYQWQNERNSISPLLLEALFACSGRLSDDPAQGAQWLALANRHESSFMDVPRLSTIQALLLLLKARESLPKKGYYYRSWQTVKTIVSMSKDLDIHEHYNTHAEGRPCELDSVECLVQTRIWQALLVVEVMIGAPQGMSISASLALTALVDCVILLGRSDYGVDPETVDMRPTLDIDGLDQFEIDRSRQYAYFVRNAYHIRLITDIYHKIKKQKDWGANPRFVEKNPLFTDWLQSLPQDLQINYPSDGSPPWIPSHFVGNMHSHCHLGIILLHRPQLLASKSFAAGGGWKIHMALCYSSAKSLCRLQEGILERFGLRGLLFMQRGINFAIYCILTCTMLHLIAITSPDPHFHTDARDYFTRHMRILEKCSSAWPMPEIQAQIDSLRLAFSADINRPFELKSTFPYGSPSEPYHPSPPLGSSYHAQLDQVPSNVQNRVCYAYPMTPPISAGTEDSKSDSCQLQPMGMLAPHPHHSHSVDGPLVDENNWDPTRIINQWDLAFPVAPSNVNTNSPPMGIGQSTQGTTGVSNQFPVHYEAPKMSSIATTQPLPQTQFNGHTVLFTARDWQQSVASVYDPNGLKRRWAHSIDTTEQSNTKRQRESWTCWSRSLTIELVSLSLLGHANCRATAPHTSSRGSDLQRSMLRLASLIVNNVVYV
ncbi:putative C6 finger domain protein [Aspergillus fumigatus]|uniref:C6 finger domain protein, putative n=2 Tax=Aspergillus fumigatus TaxID=746128 RepID=Q4WCL8_ASPFU|nr:C6 finger domain protein, putative [Aspergillus fumigatus Af293]EAL85166.1 C6 finger domain protein, putative [Aspergillus fumigatus Af293]EDP48911.1 C6 finger domain protein, putative [Aspergillus fumigatus A1163]